MNPAEKFELHRRFEGFPAGCSIGLDRITRRDETDVELADQASEAYPRRSCKVTFPSSPGGYVGRITRAVSARRASAA